MALKMLTSVAALFLLLHATLTVTVTAQTENQTLVDILTPQFAPVLNEAANVLFPNEVLTMETPLATRYALLAVLSQYTIFAACHPKALSFLGRKDPIPEKFCTATSRAKIFWFLFYRLCTSQYPVDAISFVSFLQRNGLDVLTDSVDTNTEVGWSNKIAKDLLAYFETDGWNSLGDVTRTNYRQQYEDSTGYEPQNRAEMDATSLLRPLRWQPLIQAADDRGRFTSQVHVVPHIGTKAKPIVLTEKQLEAKKVPSPYKSPNLKKRISGEDKRTMKKQIKELFERNRALTKEQVALSHWWDNKFISLGSFIGFYQLQLGFDNGIVSVLSLGEAIAQHDALLVGWKEKVRHDLVRPTSMVRRFLKGKKVRAFKSLEEGVGLVEADEWEPIIKVMPHSEYPSGSALLCTATLDHLQAALPGLLGNNITIPPYEVVIPPLLLSSPVTEPVKITFSSLKEAAKSCGQSRLFAGIHFTPSVPAGEKLAEGIGEMAFLQMKELYEGRVPDSCHRCKKN